MGDLPTLDPPVQMLHRDDAQHRKPRIGNDEAQQRCGRLGARLLTQQGRKDHVAGSKKDGEQYNSLKSLCEKSRDFFLQKLGEVDKSAFLSTRLRGNGDTVKKMKLLDQMKNLTEELNGIIAREGDNDLEVPKDLFRVLFDEDGSAKYEGMTRPISR